MRLQILMTALLVTGVTVFASDAEAQNCKKSACPASSTMTISIANSVATDDTKKTSDIVDTAVAAGSFKTLVAAVKAAGLVDTLKSKGPFTVFAPTDDAFAKLPAGTVETLVKPENKEKLQAILKYHVAGKKLEAKDVIRLRLLEMALGKDTKIGVDENGVTINGAKIVKTDIQCSNGVIHVIDAVILPE